MSNPAPLPNRAEVGSLAWRRATGLMTLSDLALEYMAVRSPRGLYSVPLPEDLVDGR